MANPTLLFLAGSARKDSINKKLAKHASLIAEEKGGANVEFIDLKDFEMPIYNGDLEAESGLPENAEKLKQLFIKCNGFFITSPEYNSSFSPLLKNSLDWISRPSAEGEKPLIAFAGKTAAICAASPGGFGGLRGLVPLRMMLGNINVHVIPEQLAISHALSSFDNEGKLVNEQQLGILNNIVEKFIKTATALKGD